MLQHTKEAEDIDERAKLLFAGHFPIEEWPYIDEADRTYWRLLAVNKLKRGEQQ